MFSLTKLKKLPKKIRLRKTVAIIQTLETDIALNRPLPSEYILSLLSYLSEEALTESIKTAIKTTQQTLRSGCFGTDQLHRNLNSIRHALLSLLDIEPADWDFYNPVTTELDPVTRTIMPIKVYLEDIRAPFNVGSIFRTAEAFCVEEVLLSQSTPRPTHPKARKTSRGTTKIMPWRVMDIGTLKPEDNVFALEIGGTPLDEFEFPKSGIVLLGSEELGLSPQALQIAEESSGRVTIPVYGAKRSLNVSVAYGILMHMWTRSLSITDGT